MKKMKKLLCLVVVVAFALSMVMVSNAAIPTTDTSKAYTIQWYMIGATDQPAASDVLSEVNKVIKPKINATLKFNCMTWGDYEQKMAVKVASNEKFDICFTASWCGFPFGINVSKGAFVDLTDMLDKYAPKTKAVLGPAVIAGASINGRLYGIPTNKEMAHNWLMVYRSDIAKELNIDMSKVKKLSDMDSVLAAVKKAKPTMYAYESVVGESAYRVLDFEKIADDNVPGAIYAPWYNKAGKAGYTVVNDFDTPEAKAFYATMNKWYKAGYLRKDSDTITDWQADPRAGKTFALLQSGKPGKAAELESQLNQQLDQIDLTPPVQTTREMTGSINVISKTSQDPARALMFLEIMNTDPKVNNLMNFGVEGKQYVVESDGRIKDGPKVKDYQLNMQWAMGNQFINLLRNNEDPKKWEKFKSFNDSAKQSPILGFTYDQKAVKTQIAALTGVKRQYFPLLETGKGDYKKYLPIMNSKFKASGLSKVLADMQKQINAFVAKKK